MTPRWVVALFAIAFATFGVLSAVYAFAGEGTYRDLARGRGTVTFVTPDASWDVDEGTLVALHDRTRAYVMGEAPAPAALPDGRPLFDESERGHLADVRAVFGAVRWAIVVSGLVLMAVLLSGVRRLDLLRTVRAGAIASATGVLVLALVFAIAFEPAFLAFHYVFFPQGNFLFDPATSNLLRLYPEPYWYGVTLRIGVAFVASSLLLAVAAHAAIRARDRR